MVNLIDVEAAIERARKSDYIVGSSIWETSEVIDFLEDEPIIDAVPVIRCKDCKYFELNPFDGCEVCTHISGYVRPDFGCVDGERKDNG